MKGAFCKASFFVARILRNKSFAVIGPFILITVRSGNSKSFSYNF